MPIVMKKIYEIKGNYTADETIILTHMIDQFRVRMADDYSEKNILNKKQLAYSDNDIVKLLYIAVDDINSGYPKTDYGIVILDSIDGDMVVSGAIIFALMKEGLLQLRNQIDFSDSGLSIAMFNKTTLYQGWLGFMVSQYTEAKRVVKSGVIPSSITSGFLGIGSEFGYDGW